MSNRSDNPILPWPAPDGGHFATTHWSVVLAAGRKDGPQAKDALAELCRTYWYPLYAYVRRRGHSPQDAEDLTQAFLAKVIEKDVIRRADRTRGLFRSFLLTALKHFLSDERSRAKTWKRGGSVRLIPMDAGLAETRYLLEPVDDRSADKIFEHQWAVTVLETVFERLRGQYEAEGKAALFSVLKGCLVQSKARVPYADLGDRLHMTEGSLRVAAHRLRQRYRDLLRAEIAHTVADPGEVDEELGHLFRVLGG